MSRAKQILESILEEDLDDLAAYFVEDEVGMYDFVHNWELMKKRPTLLKEVSSWLKAIDYPSSELDAKELVAAVDRLAGLGGWNASFLA